MKKKQTYYFSEDHLKTRLNMKKIISYVENKNIDDTTDSNKSDASSSAVPNDNIHIEEASCVAEETVESDVVSIAKKHNSVCENGKSYETKADENDKSDKLVTYLLTGFNSNTNNP